MITVSEGIEEEMLNSFQISPTSIQTIYNSFDSDDILTLADEIITDIPQVEYLIHVGRFAIQKRHDILFKALKLTRCKLPIVLLCHNKKESA
ncbi:hypothetical protein [Shewanella baltica]|uniref:hypothetical protein n=1 Tax=Shewanella baltica TaxID=62322 RepID=UPI00217D0AF1|nr:hypothetical protein [Shewanella baltica]MCS6125493.1 glycosyltransferase [Shewanella baltica]MCS6178578.1 glycosyltransferase [Shewanella baltica]MCS6254724.1 glycosyltransferase [Shewanella baltica]